ncbi:MAG: histidine kinase [Rubrivivax sp.]|jgi:sensor histidine kinase YesM|nr:histidine kinase [Rubrivivax sp.]
MPTAPDIAPPHGGHHLGRSLGFMVVLCLLIALLLTAMDGGRLHIKFVYSLSIGLCCWGLTDGLRRALQTGVRRRRAALGLDGLPPYRIGWAAMAPLMLMAVLVGPPLGLAIGDALTGFRSTSLLNWEATSTRVTFALALIGSLAAWFAMTLIERLAVSRADAEAARRLAAENQLKLLQAQLEPHMLFNTLANLRVLIGLDPAQAQAMLDRLIAFLRATLAASRQPQHALATEFDRIADYLALMSLRMGPRLTVQLELPEDLRRTATPTLLLQPLVENSIRHGLEPKVGAGRLEVRAERDGDALVLLVRDSGVGLVQSSSAAPPPTAGSGFGLEQVRARLATLYGARASLTLTAAEGGGTEARIRMPCTALDTPT